MFTPAEGLAILALIFIFPCGVVAILGIIDDVRSRARYEEDDIPDHWKDPML